MQEGRGRSLLALGLSSRGRFLADRVPGGEGSQGLTALKPKARSLRPSVVRDDKQMRSRSRSIQSEAEGASPEVKDPGLSS